jgi:hypothetical protein
MAQEHDFLPPPDAPPPPNIGDLAANNRMALVFSANVQHVANRVGMDPGDLFELVRSRSIRPADLADVFGKYGLKHDDIAGLRNLMPPELENPNPILTRAAHEVEPVRFPARRVVTRKRIPLDEILQDLDRLESRYSGDPTDDARNAVRAYREKIQAKWNPAGDPNKGVSYRQTNSIKRGAQRDAKAARTAEKSGIDPRASKAESAAAQLVGRRARKALDNGTDRARVPGLNAQNAETQKAINVIRALRDAPFRHAMNPEFTIPAAIGGLGFATHQAPLPTTLAALGTSLAFGTQKPLLSRAALATKNPVVQQGVRQIPRLADYLAQYPFNQDYQR